MPDGHFAILVACGHLFKTVLQLWTHVHGRWLLPDVLAPIYSGPRLSGQDNKIMIVLFTNPPVHITFPLTRESSQTDSEVTHLTHHRRAPYTCQICHHPHFMICQSSHKVSTIQL